MMIDWAKYCGLVQRAAPMVTPLKVG